MASIKIKFRHSSVSGKEGTLFYQIIHQRHVKQIYTAFHIRECEWNGVDIIIPDNCSADRKAILADIRQQILNGRSRLKAIVVDLDKKAAPYSVEQIADAFNNPPSDSGFISFAINLIGELTRIGRVKTARRFRGTVTSLLKYTGNSEIPWSEFNSSLISGYEEFMFRNGLCRNSTSFYMRNLRAIANRAIESDCPVGHNPFKHVYMGIDKTVKRAVSLRTICAIRDIDLSAHPALDFARNAFMFSFYTRGMSFVDMAFLRKSDVQDGILTYRRRKTRQLIRVKIEAPTRHIIDNMGADASGMLLPIITDTTADAELQYLNAYHRINRNLKTIGKMLGMETKLTMYVARHTWASIARNNNIPIATISQAMGHDSEATTRIYLSSLDTACVDRANSKILKLMATE